MTSKQQEMLWLGIYPGYTTPCRSAKLTSYTTSRQEIWWDNVGYTTIRSFDLRCQKCYIYSYSKLCPTFIYGCTLTWKFVRYIICPIGNCSPGIILSTTCHTYTLFLQVATLLSSKKKFLIPNNSLFLIPYFQACAKGINKAHYQMSF